MLSTNESEAVKKRMEMLSDDDLKNDIIERKQLQSKLFGLASSTNNEYMRIAEEVYRNRLAGKG